LLTDWQEAYLKEAMTINDFSFSEMTRILISEGILHFASIAYPEYKPELTTKEHGRMIKKGANPNTPAEEKHRLIAKLYFEARKVAEYRKKKIKRQKKAKNASDRKRKVY